MSSGTNTTSTNSNSSLSQGLSQAAARGFTSQTFRTRCDQALEDQLLGFQRLSLKSPHCDLLNFLAAADKSRIDYLPLSWYSSAPVGRGGYATINESVVHANLSYAYRRASNWRSDEGNGQEPRDQSNSSDLEGKDQDYQPAMMELTILAHPPIREHENIIQLEGISWEVVPEESRIVPVFVYERMPFGDLWRFRDSSEFETVGLPDKLALCMDIGKALVTLQSCGERTFLAALTALFAFSSLTTHQNTKYARSEIIHGDIKPQNILIGRTEENKLKSIKSRYMAKMADFGSSRVVRTDDMTFCFPETTGWTAPEHHHRGYDASQGYGMDLYRFCLTCLWLLLNDQVGAVDARSAQKIVHEVREAIDPCQKAVEVIGCLGYDPLVTGRLSKLFARALARDPAARQQKVKTIMSLLDPQWKESRKRKRYYTLPPDLAKTHSRFRVSWGFEQLLCANYLVRKLIFRSLKTKAASSPCKKCRRFAAFQVAFCYYVGFGTKRDQELASRIVSHPDVKKTVDDLEEEAEEVSGTWVFSNYRFRKLAREGFSLMVNHVAEYRTNTNYDLEEVIGEYTRETADMGASFPDMPEVSLLPKLTLAHLLHDTGFSDRAVPLYREALSAIKEASPTKSYRQGVSQENLIMNHLADALRSLGRLKEAEAIAQEALALNPTPDNELCLQIKSNLASIHYGMEKWQQAAEGFREAYEAFGKVLGARHPNTIHAMTNWAIALSMIEQYDEKAANPGEAESLCRKCLEICRQVLDDVEKERPHEISILTRSTLATAIMRRGMRDSYSYMNGTKGRQDVINEALEMMRVAVQDSVRTVGSLDPVTMAVKSQLAGMYGHLGRQNEATVLFREVLREQRERYHGVTHPSVIKTLDALLTILSGDPERRAAELDATIGREGVEKLKELAGSEGKRDGVDFPALTRFRQAWLLG
ncbi:Protein kinase-like domain containing protein [Naviculisporaceae sp. PSN 640]